MNKKWKKNLSYYFYKRAGQHLNSCNCIGNVSLPFKFWQKIFLSCGYYSQNPVWLSCMLLLLLLLSKGDSLVYIEHRVKVGKQVFWLLYFIGDNNNATTRLKTIHFIYHAAICVRDKSDDQRFLTHTKTDLNRVF